MRMILRRSWVLLFGWALLLGGEVPVLAAPGTADDGYEAPEPGTYELPVIKMAGDGEVLDTKARPVRLREFTHGRVTVMSFIYTRCAAARACPYATGVMIQLHQRSTQDAALSKGMRLVSLSFDPDHDTPEHMAGYARLARTSQPAAEWHFLTSATPQHLRPILQAYGQAVDEKANSKDPTGPLNHTLRVFLIDAEGRVRNIYSSGTLDIRLVLSDVKTLLAESARSTAKPLTPEESTARPGEVCTVAFKVETAARVTDITTRERPQAVEVLLLDAPNDTDLATPTERARIVVRIDAADRHRFGARSLDELARRFEGRVVAVTGRIETEPYPLLNGTAGGNQLRARITVADPNQIRIAEL